MTSEFSAELVQLLVRALLYQNCLCEVGRIDHDDLRTQWHGDEGDGDQHYQKGTRHHSSSSELSRAGRVRRQFKVARQVHLDSVALANRDRRQPIQKSVHRLRCCLRRDVSCAAGNDDRPVSLSGREAGRTDGLGKTADKANRSGCAERRPVMVVDLVFQSRIADLVRAGILVQAVAASIR